MTPSGTRLPVEKSVKCPHAGLLVGIPSASLILLPGRREHATFNAQCQNGGVCNTGELDQSLCADNPVSRYSRNLKEGKNWYKIKGECQNRTFFRAELWILQETSLSQSRFCPNNAGHASSVEVTEIIKSPRPPRKDKRVWNSRILFKSAQSSQLKHFFIPLKGKRVCHTWTTDNGKKSTSIRDSQF